MANTAYLYSKRDKLYSTRGKNAHTRCQYTQTNYTNVTTIRIINAKIYSVYKSQLLSSFSLFFFFSFFLYFFTPAFAQDKDIAFSKANFPDQLDKLKEAVSAIKEGDRYYHVDRVLHPIALEHFLKAQAFNPDNAELNQKVGRCYLNSNQKLKALEHLEKSVRLDPSQDEEIHLYLGEACQLHKLWDKAIGEYRIYKDQIPASDEKNHKFLQKRMDECNFGKELEKKPIKVNIENMDALNTPYAEYGPIISADEAVMVFTSRREGTTGNAKDQFVNQYYEDIYISNSVNGVWEAPQNIGDPLNTNMHDGAIGLSVDGQKMFVYVDDRGDGNIYVSQLKGDKWNKPKKMDKNINSVHRESSASFSPDEQTIYFVSNKPEDNIGDRDIFYSKIDSTGKWGKPVNIGAVINTEYGEEGAFMHPDGKTLFFSSQGHNSMGGYDIFMTVYDETTQTWSNPENLGSPVNTPDDDVFIVLSADSKHGYYTSFRAEGKGEKDIYRITFLEDIMNKNVALVKGLVTDEEKKPVGAKITVKNTTTGETVGTFESNSATGKYLLSLPSGKNYEVLVAAEGYVTHKEALDIAYKNDYQEILKDIVLKSKSAYISGKVVDEKGNGITADIEVVDNATGQVMGKYKTNADGTFRLTVPPGKNYGVVFSKPGYLFQSVNVEIPDEVGYEKNLGDITLQKIDVGKKIVMNNIFFDFNKATIRQESLSELERAVKLLNDMVSLQIEISGHTDNVGSQSVNQKLSEQRAKAVVGYLIEKGVDKKRLRFKGYAFSQPVASNDTEEGRQMNRRTEFKVLKVDVEAEQMKEAQRMKERIIADEKIDTRETTKVQGEEDDRNKMKGQQGEEEKKKINEQEVQHGVEEQKIAGSSQQPATGKVPERFTEADKDGDGKISSSETLAIIDAFFDGTTQMKPEDILALIDYFFDQ